MPEQNENIISKDANNASELGAKPVTIEQFEEMKKKYGYGHFVRNDKGEIIDVKYVPPCTPGNDLKSQDSY